MGILATRLRRGALVAGATSCAVLMSAGTALAHDCINVSRSDKGNTMAASNSQAWETVTLEEITSGFVGEDGPWTTADQQCVLEKAAAAGIPTSFTTQVKVATGVIAANNPQDKVATDGHGIDEWFTTYGGSLFDVVVNQCGAAFPE